MNDEGSNPGPLAPSKEKMTMRKVLSLAVFALRWASATTAGAQTIDWQKVDAAIGPRCGRRRRCPSLWFPPH